MYDRGDQIRSRQADRALTQLRTNAQELLDEVYGGRWQSYVAQLPPSSTERSDAVKVQLGLERLAYPDGVPERLREHVAYQTGHQVDILAEAAQGSPQRSDAPLKANVMFEGLSREQRRELRAAHPEGGVFRIGDGAVVEVPVTEQLVKQPRDPKGRFASHNDEPDILAEFASRARATGTRAAQGRVLAGRGLRRRRGGRGAGVRTVSEHRCERRHRSYAAMAKCVWPRATWVTGNGPFASVSRCAGDLTVSLHSGVDEANEAKARIDQYGCGAFCSGKHEILELRLRGKHDLRAKGGSTPSPSGGGPGTPGEGAGGER